MRWIYALGLLMWGYAAAETVVPIPEADQNCSSSSQVKAIIVDKKGDMTQTEYVCDPDQGGVVINNNEADWGEGASLFFPAFEMGLLWDDGVWVDEEGYYWDG